MSEFFCKYLKTIENKPKDLRLLTKNINVKKKKMNTLILLMYFSFLTGFRSSWKNYPIIFMVKLQSRELLMPICLMSIDISGQPDCNMKKN